MTSLIANQGWEEQRHVGGGARILLVNKDPRDLSYYATILKERVAECEPVRALLRERSAWSAGRMI